jgi:hypothetical protein
MLEITLHLTRASRPWTLLVLGLEVFLLRSKKSHRFNGDIQRLLKRKMLLQQKRHLNKIKGESDFC